MTAAFKVHSEKTLDVVKQRIVEFETTCEVSVRYISCASSEDLIQPAYHARRRHACRSVQIFRHLEGAPAMAHVGRYWVTGKLDDSGNAPTGRVSAGSARDVRTYRSEECLASGTVFRFKCLATSRTH